MHEMHVWGFLYLNIPFDLPHITALFHLNLTQRKGTSLLTFLFVLQFNKEDYKAKINISGIFFHLKKYLNIYYTAQKQYKQHNSKQITSLVIFNQFLNCL